jgi:hypothetical protein
MPAKNRGQLYEYLEMPYENLGMLQLFAMTLCEGEEGIREESRGHRPLLLVPASFRRERSEHEERPSEHAERPSQHAATPRAYPGTPSTRRERPQWSPGGAGGPASPPSPSPPSPPSAGGVPASRTGPSG